MSELPDSPNKRVSTGQVRSLAAIWVVLTVVAGAGTFFGLSWALGGFDDTVEVAKSAPEIVAEELVTPGEVVVTELPPTLEPAVAETSVDPTQQLVEPTMTTLADPETATAEPTSSVAAVVSTEDGTVLTPGPTATTAPVVSGSTQFSLGGQV
ncbi:MAG: hypothetical protein QF660_03500, partial [Anaerolineales bacterium]|nr:hypothetical protein [Anaerolineales bacterium]